MGQFRPIGCCLQYVLVWNPVSLASPGKQGGKSPNAPCCDKGASALAYQFLELLYPCVCKDGEMWEHHVSSSLQCLHSWGVEFAVWGKGWSSCCLEDKDIGSSWPLWSTWVGGEGPLDFSKTLITFCQRQKKAFVFSSSIFLSIPHITVVKILPL